MKRRNFIKNASLAGTGVLANLGTPNNFVTNKSKPIILSTWNHGLKANETAWEIIKNNGKAIDAVEAGVRETEADPKVASVGLGGLPDRDGNVTLDACIMNEVGDAGSVAYLKNILHPISLARKVMEDTPHVMLVGDGAEKFAAEKGFKKTNLLTAKSKADYKEWLKKSEYKPIINIENHDTIGQIALDKNQNFSGACTTSGLSYKMAGRVGDSPIIGAGLFVDPEFGAATATGLGEMVMKTLGSFLIVELMRQGASPQEACEEGVKRIMKQANGKLDFQIGYIAIDKKGQHGAAAVHKGFQYAITFEGVHELRDAKAMAD